MRVNSAKLTSENYSAGCGNACPLCGEFIPSEFTGSKPFHRSAYEQNYIGWANPPFPGRTNKVEVAVVFECEFCFKLYWFHWPKDAVPGLALNMKRRKSAAQENKI